MDHIELCPHSTRRDDGHPKSNTSLSHLERALSCFRVKENAHQRMNERNKPVFIQANLGNNVVGRLLDERMKERKKQIASWNSFSTIASCVVVNEGRKKSLMPIIACIIINRHSWPSTSYSDPYMESEQSYSSNCLPEWNLSNNHSA